MKKLPILAACAGMVLSMAPLPVAAADSPDDIVALIQDSNAYFKKGLSALDDAERHWKLGNTSQTCDSLSEAQGAFMHAWKDEQQVRSDVIDNGLLTGEDATTVKQWISDFEAQIDPITEKMHLYGTHC
jgi:hypothetical protein